MTIDDPGRRVFAHEIVLDPFGQEIETDDQDIHGTYRDFGPNKLRNHGPHFFFESRVKKISCPKSTMEGKGDNRADLA